MDQFCTTVPVIPQSYNDDYAPYYPSWNSTWYDEELAPPSQSRYDPRFVLDPVLVHGYGDTNVGWHGSEYDLSTQYTTCALSDLETGFSSSPASSVASSEPEYDSVPRTFIPEADYSLVGPATVEASRGCPYEPSGTHGDSQRACRICSKIFSKAYELDNHAKEEKHKAFQCEDCGKEYVRQSALARHRTTTHGSPLDHTCVHCSEKSFRRKDHLQQHLREVHGKVDCVGSEGDR